MCKIDVVKQDYSHHIMSTHGIHRRKTSLKQLRRVPTQNFFCQNYVFSLEIIILTSCVIKKLQNTFFTGQFSDQNLYNINTPIFIAHFAVLNTYFKRKCLTRLFSFYIFLKCIPPFCPIKFTLKMSLLNFSFQNFQVNWFV